MPTIYSGKVMHTFGDYNSTLQLSLDYSYYRNGADMYYSFSGSISCVPGASGGTARFGYTNNVSMSLDGSNIYSDSFLESGKNWTWYFSASDKKVSNKTSGTTPFSISVSSSGIYSFSGGDNLSVSPAGSTISSTTAGTTLNGPTINITKYNSGFYDVIVLSYGSASITRSGFTSSKLTFSEAERKLIFGANGAGSTKTWNISGTTYTSSGGSSVGTYSGTVSITTEALSKTTPQSFNVPNYPTYKADYTCGGKYSIYAYTNATDRTNGTNAIFSRTNLTASVAAGTSASTMSISSIYNYNTTSQSGTIYWRTISYINNELVGSVDTSSTYNFVQSDCGPSLSTLQYKVTDAGTKALMSITDTYYNYNSGTNLNKFIKGKTTLGLKMQGSVAANKGTNLGIKKYEIYVPGQSTGTITTSSTSAQTYNTTVLSSNGTLSVRIYDTRNFWSELSFTYNLNDYYDPVAIIDYLQRNPMTAVDPSADTKVRVHASISIPNYIATHLMNNSSYYIKYQYSTNGTTWTTGSDIKSSFTISGNTMITTDNPGYLLASTSFDKNTQYQFRLVIKSYYASSTKSNVMIIPISAPVISRRLRKVGINTIPISHTLEVGGNIYANTTIEAGTSITAGTSINAGSSLYINNIRALWYE